LILLSVGSFSRPAQAEGEPLVLAFYYAWYDMNTWSSGLPADQPREPYTSADRGTIERHVSQAQAAGVDALIQSWYGPQEASNQTETNFRVLLELAAARKLRAAVDFETTGPFFPDRASVVDALRHLLSVHAQHPAYLRYQGKPVIFFWRQQRFSVEEWAAIRSEVDPDHSSLWIAEGVDIAYQAVFDGHYLYSIAWSNDVQHTLANWASRVHQYETQHGVDRLWVATVMPGYDDTRTGRADAFVVNRREGDYYREAWAAATASQPDWVVITSFNEWIEGTMIEPGASYGDLYLDLTWKLAAAFRAGGGAPAQSSPEEEDSNFQAEPVDQAAPLAGPTPVAASSEAEEAAQAGPYVRAEEAVRVRSGPGASFPRIGRLSPGETAPVVGKNAGASWWQIEYSSAEAGLGWVTAEFVTLVGNPSLVPVAGNRTPTPTRISTPTPSPSPPPPSPTRTRATPTVMRTATGTPTATPAPSPTPTSTATVAPTSTPPPAGSPSATPAPTRTPTIRTAPSVRHQPVGLLWIGIGALISAVPFGVLLFRARRRQR
jgi:uncharacterized protein YraI